MKFLINKSFKTNTMVTSRVLQVAEAFGLGIDGEKEFVVYDNFPVELNKGDVVYITGDSGGGKSVLMKELQTLTNGVSTADVVIDYDLPIVEAIGKDLDQALYFLNLVGLSDAFICLRKFGELSDGQKSRFILAKMLEMDNDYLFIDEFCALLDRTTAKIVSYGIQKIIRKLGKVLVVATTHEDILEDLNPSIFIKKHFGDEAKVTLIPYEPRPCSIADEVEISLGETKDYHDLSKFHYRTHQLGAAYQIYRMTHKDELIGVIVYAYGPLALRGRNTFTDRYKGRAKLMNREVKMISRVVVLPKYRGIGLSVKLVKETMPMTGMKHIEILSVMGKHNPFAEKAGMTVVDVDPAALPGDRKKLYALYEKHNLDMQMIGSTQYNEEKLAEMPVEDQSAIYDCVVSLNKSVYGGAGKQRYNEKGHYDESKLRRCAELMKSTIDTEKVYAIWTNESFSEEEAEANMKWFEEEKAKSDAEKAAKKKAKEAAEAAKKAEEEQNEIVEEKIEENVEQPAEPEVEPELVEDELPSFDEIQTTEPPGGGFPTGPALKKAVEASLEALDKVVSKTEIETPPAVQITNEKLNPVGLELPEEEELSPEDAELAESLVF